MKPSFTVTSGAKYLTGMVTTIPPYETFEISHTLYAYY
jgi:hypothetical protein